MTERAFADRAMESWQRKTSGHPQLHEVMRAEVSYTLKMPLSLTDGARLCLAVIDKEGKGLLWSVELPMALDHSSDNAIDAVTFSYDVSSLRPAAPIRKEPTKPEGAT